MRHFSIALVAVVSTIAITEIASAADMPIPIKGPAPIAAPAFNWTGFYVGAQAGYGFGETSSSFSGFDAGDTPPSVSPDGGGIVLGGQAGYNYQFGILVAGVEADIAYAHFRGSASSVSVNGVTQPTEQDINWLGTVRARLGVLPTDRLLVFATGGVAFGGVGVSSSLGPSGGTCAISSCGSGSASATNTGGAVGGGLEYAVSNNITFKAEYLFVDLGSLSLTYPITLAVSQSMTTSNFRASIARVGLNYKF